MESRYTTPQPDYGNLYLADTPPSAQPRSPLSDWEVPESQQTTQSWDSRNGPRPQINESQLSTQSWDSRDGPRPVTPQQDSLFIQPTPSPPAPLSPLSPTYGPPPFIPDSQDDSSQSSNGSCWPRAPDCTRDKRLQIQTALLFKIDIPTIRETLDVTEAQIVYVKTHRLTPQKTKGGRHA